MPEKQRQQRHKALTRQYKDTPKRMGVYCITNLQNQQMLVASSRDLDARLNRHRFDLKLNGERISPALQAQWNQFGPEAFEFRILGVLDPLDTADYDPTEDLAELEAMWRAKMTNFQSFE